MLTAPELRLLRAAEAGDLRLITRCCETDCSLDARTARDGVSALGLAVRSAHVEAVALLLRAGADPALADDDGSTPLHDALSSDVYGLGPARHVLVELLLEARAPTDPVDFAGASPLALATAFDDVASARLLLSAGASPGAREQPLSPLGVASRGIASQAHLEVGRLLAEAAGLGAEWEWEEARLHHSILEARRRRGGAALLGGCLDDDVCHLVISCLGKDLASLTALAQVNRRWAALLSSRLGVQRRAARLLGEGLTPPVLGECAGGAEALSLWASSEKGPAGLHLMSHLDLHSLACLALASPRWSKFLAAFLSSCGTLWEAHLSAPEGPASLALQHGDAEAGVAPHELGLVRLLAAVATRANARTFLAILAAANETGPWDQGTLLIDHAHIVGAAAVRVRGGWTAEDVGALLGIFLDSETWETWMDVVHSRPQVT